MPTILTSLDHHLPNSQIPDAIITGEPATTHPPTLDHPPDRTGNLAPGQSCQTMNQPRTTTKHHQLQNVNSTNQKPSIYIQQADQPRKLPENKRQM
jgi:hypothetical protein